MSFAVHFQSLAHAYVLEGDHRVIGLELQSLLEKDHGVVFQGNPDVWKGAFNTFTIEHAREIKEMALNRKMGTGKRIFILTADSMTREASNALLKTLEEPAEDTHFFIILPTKKRVLPTILSRVRVVQHPSLKESLKENALTPEVFFFLSSGERLKKIKERLTRLDNEEISKAEIASLIEDLLRWCHEHKKDKTQSLEKQAYIAGYATDQSASLKMLLEYFALVA